MPPIELYQVGEGYAEISKAIHSTNISSVATDMEAEYV
jgi:hypothetical protein